MRVGPKHWLLVSTDTAGVPHGGKFGNVRWFERAAKKHGMKIGWSKLRDCFGIYTEPWRGVFISQLLCIRQDTFEPVPLNHELLSMLVQMQEAMASQTGDSLMHTMQKLTSERKYKEATGKRETLEDMEKDVTRATLLRRGKVTPNIMVLPNLVRVGNG